MFFFGTQCTCRCHRRIVCAAARHLFAIAKFLFETKRYGSISKGLSSPSGGVECAGGMKKSRFSTNISLYLRNDTRYSHSYYGMRKGNLTTSFRTVPFLDRTYHAHQFIFSFFLLYFLFVPCGRLSWLSWLKIRQLFTAR